MAMSTAVQAVQRLRESSDANDLLMKWPEGHLPNLPVVGGTYIVKVAAQAVAFTVRQEGEVDRGKKRYLIAYVT